MIKRKNSFGVTKQKCYKAFWLLFLCFLIVKVCINQLRIEKLREEGVLTVARVYERKKRHKADAMRYEFEVAGQRYTGETTVSEAKVGKMIFVVYLPSDPSVNESNRFVGLKEPYE